MVERIESTSTAGELGTEGSGLIDLRALGASITEQSRQTRDEREEIASVVTACSALAPAVVPPVRERAPARGVAALVASAATLVISLVAFAAVPSWSARTPPAERVAVVESPPPTPLPELAPAPVPEPVPEAAPDPTPAPAPRPRTPSRPSRGHVARVPAAPTRVPAEGRAPPASGATPEGSIDPALAAAVDAALSGARGATAADSLPATPPQHEVRSTLRGLERAVAACREGEGGVVEVRLAIEGASGRVVGVDVRGEAVRGGVAACVEDVVDDARFSRFSRDRLAVTYPFRI